MRHPKGHKGGKKKRQKARHHRGVHARSERLHRGRVGRQKGLEKRTESEWQKTGASTEKGRKRAMSI